ncbi:thermonuclease family protein [Sphingobacterium sp. LRF_L2]|uniref:thermonuclease family protein n=1 Tax=Sphingobacterium sp. LRF_L2 TaxID=3369421 RepID=UPI003F60C2A9
MFQTKLLHVFWIVLLASNTSYAQIVLKGQVIKITDGDTTTLLDNLNKQYRIILYGIYCPETGQDFGTVARKFTSDLFFTKTVTVEVKDIDRYSRQVGIVWVDRETNNKKVQLYL